MKKATAALAVMLALLLSSSESSARRLADLIPGLYSGDGITLAPPLPPIPPQFSHAPHFRVDSAASINRLNEQIVAETGVFPFSSSVGGFTFAFEKELGTFVQTTETLGPLFAERAPTLGRGRLNLNFAFTFFKYDTFQGTNLNNVEVVARHQPDVIPPPDVPTLFELDTLRIKVDLDIDVQIFALAASYGITDRLDVGILVPIASVDMKVKSHADIIVSPENPFPGIHTFVGGPESPDDAANGNATGLGDIVLRAKYHLLKGAVVDIAGAVLAKLATGDEKDFLGTGTTTVRPFLIFSRTLFDVLTPHLNIGYEFNLDRDAKSAVKYAAGFDVGTKKFTVAADLLGSDEPNGDGIGDNIFTGSLGIKWNPWKQLLLSANAQFPLNKSGLRSNFIPTFGVEYTF